MLVHKIILKIPKNTPFFYTSAFFYLPIFVYSDPYSLHQNYFPYLSHLANSSCIKGSMSNPVKIDTFLIPLFFLKV